MAAVPIQPPPGATRSSYSSNFPPDKIPENKRQLQWLNRSITWTELPWANWQPKKVLGGGASGIVGRWDYRGQPPAGTPSSLVVKQVGASDFYHNLLMWESKILRDLKARGSEHIIELYFPYHRAGGTGTMDVHDLLKRRVDPLPFDANGTWVQEREVGRIFLEFCPGGNLLDEVGRAHKWRLMPTAQWIPEEDLWRIFECLAKGVHVLETGLEDPAAAHLNPTWQRVAHLDLKPENIFVGEKSPQGAPDHTMLEIVKLADFGSAFPYPPDTRDPAGNLHDLTRGAGSDFWKHAKWRGTPGYRPPEQLYNNNRHRAWSNDYRKLNVWGIGAIMHRLITGEFVNMEKRWNHTTHIGIPWENGTGGLNNKSHNPYRALGIDFFGGFYPNPAAGEPLGYGPNGDQKIPYSKRLIDLIILCLAYEAGHRIDISTLTTTIRAHIAAHYPRRQQGHTLKRHRGWNLQPQPANAPPGDMGWSAYYNANPELVPGLVRTGRSMLRRRARLVDPPHAPPRNRPTPPAEDLMINLAMGNAPAAVTRTGFAIYPHQSMPANTRGNVYKPPEI